MKQNALYFRGQLYADTRRNRLVADVLTFFYRFGIELRYWFCRLRWLLLVVLVSLCAAVSLSSCHSDAHAAPGVVDSPIFVSDTMLYKDHSFIIIRERFNPYFQVLHSPSCACRYNRHFVIVKRKNA